MECAIFFLAIYFILGTVVMATLFRTAVAIFQRLHVAERSRENDSISPIDRALKFGAAFTFFHMALVFVLGFLLWVGVRGFPEELQFAFLYALFFGISFLKMAFVASKCVPCSLGHGFLIALLLCMIAGVIIGTFALCVWIFNAYGRLG